jgi:hypothetical protein
LGICKSAIGPNFALPKFRFTLGTNPELSPTGESRSDRSNGRVGRLLKLAEGPFYRALPVILPSPVKRIPARFDSLFSLCPLQMPF